MCQGRKIIDPKISIGNWVGKWPDKNRVQIGQKHRLGQKILTQKWEKSTRNWLDNFTIYSNICRLNFLKIARNLLEIGSTVSQFIRNFLDVISSKLARESVEKDLYKLHFQVEKTQKG